MDCLPVDWAYHRDLISLYVDSSKTFLSISSAAIGLTVVYREKIAGVSTGERIGLSLGFSWIFFLATVVLSGLYQYLAVKYLAHQSHCPVAEYFGFFEHQPGTIYGAMLVSFFIAACCLVHACWVQLPKAK